MVLNPDKSVSILYDLAMAMAGETRTRPLTTQVLQRLLQHTGATCGLVLLDPVAACADRHSAGVLVALGSPALRALEGRNVAWPADLLNGGSAQLAEDWLPGGDGDRHAISLELAGLGYLLLVFSEPPSQAEAYRQLFAPVLQKFARSLRHCLDSDAQAQALAQSEARFRDILQTSPDWIWEVDDQGTYTFSNGRVFELLGYTPEEVLGKTPFDFMPPQEAERIAASFRDIVAGRRAFTGLENVNLHKQGHEVVLETSGVPFFDGNGRLLGYRGIDRDITQRKRSEEALVKARLAAEASSQAKTLFLSSMSHELRTPLNAILGHAQLIAMQEGLPESVFASAREIGEAGNNLLHLVNDLIELSDIEAGGIDLKPEHISLRDVLDECLAMNAHAAELQRTPLECAHSCDCCQVVADRHGLLQALNQLVSNAIKFNRAGERVVIGCRARGDGKVRIDVTDRGPGIAAGDQAQLFVPFNRLGAEKGRIEGAGIGLAIARRLIESMSGRIGVDSGPGKGSTFWIELPAGACPSKPAVCEGTPPTPDQAAPFTGVRVLVAEDYLPNQNLLKMQLAALGCDADIADNGAKAWQKWLAGGYDLVLADLNMPELDGLALTRRLREHEAGSGRHTPVICISASDQPQDLETCLAAGMDDVLTKPITLESLKLKLARWLGRPAPAGSQPMAPGTEGDPVLDIESLYRALGDANQEQARSLLATFIEAAADGLQQLSAQPANDALAREMHKQKSSARTVGALRYARLAEALEKSARAGELQNATAALTQLGKALEAVRAAFAGFGAGSAAAIAPKPFSGLGPLLVVDDDTVILRQLKEMLTGLGAREVLTAGNGQDALKLLGEKNGDIEALLCDLDMPAMDGVEVIRLFGRTGYRGKLILMSGADEKLLNTAAKLADLQGLQVLGQVQKPVSPQQIVDLLSRQERRPSHGRALPKTLELPPAAIQTGIDRDEFEVWFQPKVEAASLQPVGVEALARWRHPVYGLLSADAFIGVAERAGLIGELSQILTSKALLVGSELHAAGFPLTIAVNLSGLWLDDLMLPDFILATTLTARLKPEDVVLEVTETGVMKDLTTALDVLTRLRLKGFGLSIDDFGIGYSSFEQLDRIPFTELKLDRSFVGKGVHDATARAILQSSLDMARRMELATVAEGVESEADLELVRQLGCQRAQGHFIARPMPIGALLDWLRSRTN